MRKYAILFLNANTRSPLVRTDAVSTQHANSSHPLMVSLPPASPHHAALKKDASQMSQCPNHSHQERISKRMRHKCLTIPIVLIMSPSKRRCHKCHNRYHHAAPKKEVSHVSQCLNHSHQERISKRMRHKCHNVPTILIRSEFQKGCVTNVSLSQSFSSGVNFKKDASQMSQCPNHSHQEWIAKGLAPLTTLLRSRLWQYPYHGRSVSSGSFVHGRDAPCGYPGSSYVRCIAHEAPPPPRPPSLLQRW